MAPLGPILEMVSKLRETKSDCALKKKHLGAKEIRFLWTALAFTKKKTKCTNMQRQCTSNFNATKLDD